MQIIPLYRYVRTDGGITVSPIKPDCEYTEKHRLVADEGKVLTNGEIIMASVDVERAEGWVEIDEPKEENEEKEEI